MTRLPRPGLAASLQREWDRMRYRPALVERARTWAVTERPFDDLDDLLQLAGFRHHGDDTAAVLRRLVIRATDDELAARVVLQRLLPGLLALVRRRSHPGGDVLEQLVAAAWIAIRTFEPRRHPACLAAALISDADHACFCRKRRRPMSSTELTIDPARAIGIPDDPHPSACEELAELLADARAAGVPSSDVDLVHRLLDADSADQVARDLHVTARTVRNRRAGVTLRLRRVALAA